MPTISPALRISANLIYNFAERESKARYKRSVLGWLWSLINPLSTVVIYSLVFGVFLKVPPPATDNGRAVYFSLYLFSGLVIWNLFLSVVNGSMAWMTGVSDLRKKIYFPTETAILGGALSSLLQSGLEALVLVAIMIGYLNVSWTYVFLPVALLQVGFFALGVGMAVAILNARYRDIQYLVGIVTNAAFFLVPIIYTMDLVPEHHYGLPVRRLIELNPITQFVGMSRDAVYFLRVPSLGRVLVTTAWSVAVFSVGWIYFRHRSMEISEEP